ncbi:MAG: hypothetical protein IV107_25650 [Paucibacter sp.]|nr:hypothetical protein [Roseateles sp.]
MNTSSHDFITVDMRGLKAALVARAQAERVSVSLLVRSAVAAYLGLSADADQSLTTLPTSPTVKLSIRLTQAEAQQLAAGARTAGLSRGAYLSGLVAGVPVLTAGASRVDHLAALHASNAELSTLSRNIHQLTALLSQVNVKPAQQYRVMLDTLSGDVRRHLMLASRVLADMQPSRRSV